MKIGNQSVVISGNLPADAEVGHQSVVIGATDSHGNVRLDPGAYGFGAQAGHGSVLVGAFAGGGATPLPFPEPLKADLLELVNIAIQNQNAPVLAALREVSAELGSQKPDAGLIHKAWAGVQALATVDGAHSLLSKATVALFTYLQSLG